MHQIVLIRASRSSWLTSGLRDFFTGHLEMHISGPKYGSNDGINEVP